MNSFLERKKLNDVKIMKEITQRLSDNTESTESTQTYIENLLDSIHNNLMNEIISKLNKKIESPQMKAVNKESTTMNKTALHKLIREYLQLLWKESDRFFGRTCGLKLFFLYFLFYIDYKICFLL